MDPKISAFLTKEKIASLTIILPDGTPHAAAMHFSHTDSPFMLYFSTENTSRKCQALLSGGMSKGAVVVGFSEQEWITFQMEGEAKIVTRDELAPIQELHYAKHPSSKKYKDDPATVFIAFTPSWYRYTDYNTKPPTFISNQ